MGRGPEEFPNPVGVQSEWGFSPSGGSVRMGQGDLGHTLCGDLGVDSVYARCAPVDVRATDSRWPGALSCRDH